MAIGATQIRDYSKKVSTFNVLKFKTLENGVERKFDAS